MCAVESWIQTLGALFSTEPVYHEYCDCPVEDPEVWQDMMSCPSQEPQITKDFISFPTIDLQRMLKEIPAKFSQTGGAIVHYTVLDNHIYRRSLGKYTDFKMFSDEMLLSLARKVLLWIMSQIKAISQNHRVVGVGRDLWRASSPTPLPKQVHPELVAQDHLQGGFWISTACLGSLFHGPIILTVRKFTLIFRWHFQCLTICLSPLVLLLSTIEKSLAPSLDSCP